MAEIVLVESSRSSRGRGGGRGEASSSSYVPPEPFDSEKLPPTMVSHIRPFLRVANQIELESPRVAYLCRFHAFARAHMLDPISTARGVRQFKTALLQRLEKDDKETFMKRKETSDLCELKCAYFKYEDYIQKHSGDSEEGEREIASVLSEVLKTVTSEAGCEIVADADGVHIQSEFYKPYNILPLEPGSENQAIMQLPEIKAAIAELRNVRGLPPAESHQKIGAWFDLFDWLQFWFGFQEGNVSNQREHLLLLLASIHARQTQSASESKLGERAVNELKKKLFRNYKAWCKFLGRKTNIWLPSVEQEVRQY